MVQCVGKDPDDKDKKNGEDPDGKDKKNESQDLVLPPLVPKSLDITNSPRIEIDKSNVSPKEDHLFPPIFTQLGEVNFSEQETDAQSSGDDSEDENSTHNAEDIDEDSDKYLEKYSKLSMAGKQPGIAIVKYVSESESMYYKYLSMENKADVDNRINEVRGKSPGCGNGGDTDGGSADMCQFCGRPITKMSLLEVIQSQEGGDDKNDNKVEITHFQSQSYLE